MTWRLVALVAGALALLTGALLLAGAGPAETLSTLVKGSLGSPGAISGTLRETTPLLLVGLGVFLALRAGLFNIGAEGQFVIGAMCGAAVATRMGGVMGILAALLVGAMGGSLWALPAGLIKAYRNGHEVITTIMLNNLALLLTGALLAGPLRGAGQQGRTTAYVPESARIPYVLNSPPLQINLALLVGLILSGLLAWWLGRTVRGFELRAVGANATAAEFAGVSVKRVTVGAMAVSGAIAGFAGALQVLASEWRFYEGFSPGYGFNALGVALLAGGNAYGVIPAATLFGILEKGGTSLSIAGVPKGITFVLLAVLILIAAAVRYRRSPAVA